MKIEDKRIIKKEKVFPKVGDVVINDSIDDEIYMVVFSDDLQKYFYLNIASGFLCGDGFDSLEEMNSDNPDDVVLKVKLVIEA